VFLALLEDSERIHKGLPLTIYDAFLLHAEEDDEFASQVVQKIEKEYKLKVTKETMNLEVFM
jgi:hypothetical protein